MWAAGPACEIHCSFGYQMHYCVLGMVLRAACIVIRTACLACTNCSICTACFFGTACSFSAAHCICLHPFLYCLLHHLYCLPLFRLWPRCPHQDNGLIDSLMAHPAANTPHAVLYTVQAAFAECSTGSLVVDCARQANWMRPYKSNKHSRSISQREVAFQRLTIFHPMILHPGGQDQVPAVL